MNRCAVPLLALAAASALTTPGAAAAAQSTSLFSFVPAASTAADQMTLRKFTRNDLRGAIVFGAPPSITLNGNATTMARGYRVHGANNLLVTAGRLAGTTNYAVNYSLNSQGQVYEVWLLTASEAAKLPWPTSAADAAAWSFDFPSQTWTRP